MKLTGKDHRYIDATFPKEDRAAMKAAIASVPEGTELMFAKNIQGAGKVHPAILVVTTGVVGFGWPVERVLWKRAAN